eukprot:3144510-Amphidinium_carterae.1
MFSDTLLVSGLTNKWPPLWSVLIAVTCAHVACTGCVVEVSWKTKIGMLPFKIFSCFVQISQPFIAVSRVDAHRGTFFHTSSVAEMSPHTMQ